MTTAEKKEATNPLANVPPWVFLLVGLSGGGASGTLLSRPVFGSDSVTKAEVQEIVDASVVRNNEYLLQKIELMLAKDKLAERADRVSPTPPRAEP